MLNVFVLAGGRWAERQKLNAQTFFKSLLKGELGFFRKR